MRRNDLYLAAVLFLATLLSGRAPALAASGCSYPASLDTFADKAAGDNLTQGDLNARTCAIEKLMAGPLRPNKGTAGAPAYSFQGDTDTGIDSLATDTVSIITAGAERVRIGSGGITTGTWAASVIGGLYGGSGANLSACAQGSVPYFSATGVQSCLAPGTDGQFFRTRGASSNPDFANPAAVLLTAKLTSGAGSTTQLINSLTNRLIWLLTLPGTLTVNQISYNVAAVTTAGTFKVCVYSEDGSSKLIDVTSGTNATGVRNVTIGSIVLQQGNYYLAIGCATTCSDTLTADSSIPDIYALNTPSGKKPYTGTVTHASGACDATLGAVTTGTISTPAVRLDN